MEDLRPFIADALTAPDFDLADFSKPSMEVGDRPRRQDQRCR